MNRPIVYLGDHTVLTKLPFGPKIYLDTREISIASHLILDGIWETWVTKHFLSIVKPGMTVLDIGANCGYYSLLAAWLVGSQGNVHAFEPNPFHHENFSKSKIVNGFKQLHLHKVALADKAGEISLFSPVKQNGGASIHEITSEVLGLDDQVTSMNVPAVVLSEYLPNIKADVIKVDIEGAEPLIMDSLFQVIDNCDRVQIIMEFNHQLWSNLGYNSESILKRFEQRGLHIQIIQHDGTLQSTTITDLLQKKCTGSTHFDLYLNTIYNR